MPAQNPNANRGERVKPKPAKKVVGKVKAKPPPASPDQADRTRQQTQQGRKPASQDHYRAPQEQQYLSQAHSVRVRATPKRGTSPSGDRPQGRSREMDRTPVRRAILVEPNTGHQVSTLKTPEAPRGAQQRGTSPSGDRPQGRAKEMRDAPTVKAKKGHGPGTVLATISPTKLASKYAAAVQWKDPRGTISGGADLATNAGLDAAELAVTTPTSLVKLGDTAIHHPKKVPGMLAEPYKQLIKDPKAFVSEHPVSTALMLQPAIRAPGRVTGKAVRATGKQTLERPAKTLPHTALKEPQKGSRDVVVRAGQSRKDKKNPAPTVTVRETQRRVDEAFGAQQKHGERVKATMMRDARAEAKKLPKAEREAHIAAASEAAHGTAKQQAHRAYGQEFGAVHQVTPQGKVVIVKPKPGASIKGVLHDTHEAAQAVADKLNKNPTVLRRGSFTKAEAKSPFVGRHSKEQVPVTFVVHKAGDKYAAIPDFVAERIRKQEGVGTSKAPGSKVLRQSRGMFTRAVLPYRPTWLSGQGIEGAVRSATMGAGPTSYIRGKRVVNAMERQQPGSGKALMDRAVPGGRIGKVMKEFAGERKTLASEFPDNPIAHALTDIGRTPGVKQVRQLHHAISNAVFTHLNGRFLEGIPQTAMLGRALKKSPLMERSTVGLFGKAIDDAARGAQQTHHQVALARTVQGAYGKYNNFGPGLREAILHWTPFIPWALNATRFLSTVLPRDHPVMAALLADADAATEEWRKAHGLSLREGTKDRLPFFMQGGYPKDNGKTIVRIGHYMPFGAATDPTGGLAGLVLPQFSGAYGAVQYGVDWKGKPLKHEDGTPFTDAEKWLYSLQQLGGALVPGVGQASNIVGADDKVKAVKKELRVIASSPAHRSTDEVKPVVVKPVKVKPVKIKPVQVP